MTAKPKRWEELLADVRTDALDWHRDRSRISTAQKACLIRALDRWAYARVHIALDAILAPLLAPYELEMRAAQAEDTAQRERMARWVVEFGEAVARFVAARKPAHPFFAGAQQYGLGLLSFGASQQQSLAQQQAALSALSGDVTGPANVEWGIICPGNQWGVSAHPKPGSRLGEKRFSGLYDIIFQSRADAERSLSDWGSPPHYTVAPYFTESK